MYSLAQVCVGNGRQREARLPHPSIASGVWRQCARYYSDWVSKLHRCNPALYCALPSCIRRWLFRDIWHSRLTHSEQNKVDIELYEHNYNTFQESIIMILLALLFRKQQRKQVQLERRDAKNEELGRSRAVVNAMVTSADRPGAGRSTYFDPTRMRCK